MIKLDQSLGLCLALAFISGCGSTPINYNSSNSLSPGDAAASIERALYSQPPQFRPDSIDVTEDYVVYGKGPVTRGRNSLLVLPIGNGIGIGSGRGSSTSKVLTDRIYFDSIADLNEV